MSELRRELRLLRRAIGCGTGLAGKQLEALVGEPDPRRAYAVALRVQQPPALAGRLYLMSALAFATICLAPPLKAVAAVPLEIPSVVLVVLVAVAQWGTRTRVKLDDG